MADSEAAAGSVDLERILEMLPHRYPMLLVDRVDGLVPGERGTGLKNVTINEPFFQGHFPGAPVMPGVLIIEAMAQTAAVVMMAKLGTEVEGQAVYFMAIDGARFRRKVVPGDVLHLDVEVTQVRRNVAKFAAKARVGDDLAAEATLTAMIAGG